ncbi:MAG: hypothetical protein JWO36_6523 [Myxococcales bacterium]|nr:hypothetical protein [Myxococcales bacterium]
MRIAVFAVALAACGGSSPENRYYQLANPAHAAPHSGEAIIAIQPLAADGAYDDERIVYRVNPYRLDYYNYHRWSAPPGTLIGNYLEQAFAKSGRFRRVVRDATDATPVVLGGRIVALEEVDASTTQWQGRIVIELTLTDTKTDQVLWSEQFEEIEPLPARNPEGMARAISVAMNRIVQRAVPVVAELAEKQTQIHEANASQRAMKIR